MHFIVDNVYIYTIFKLFFHKTAWKVVEDLFEKKDIFLFVIFVVKIVTQIINMSFVLNVTFTII